MHPVRYQDGSLVVECAWLSEWVQARTDTAFSRRALSELSGLSEGKPFSSRLIDVIVQTGAACPEDVGKLVRRPKSDGSLLDTFLLSNPRELGHALVCWLGDSPVKVVRLDWIHAPMRLSVVFDEDVLRIVGELNVGGDIRRHEIYTIGNWTPPFPLSSPRPLCMFLEHLGITEEDPACWVRERAQSYQDLCGLEVGTPIRTNGPAIRWRANGPEALPAKLRLGVINKTPEKQTFGHGSGVVPSLWINVFDLESKVTISVPAASVSVMKPDPTALDRLVVPDAHRALLQGIAQLPAQRRGKDLIDGPGGGMLLLLQGFSGTGKSLTAKLLAAHAGRPLYRVDAEELGQSPHEGLRILRKTLQGLKEWGAIVLLNDIDTFLPGHMSRPLLKQSFLECLDSFEGLMIATTTNPTLLDPSVCDRATLILQYNKHGKEERKRLWKLLLDASDLRADDADLDALASIEVNGRRIRELVSLVRAQVDGDRLSPEDVKEISYVVGPVTGILSNDR